jgi:ribosome-associated toxin RatA of RatAB toxin-antitoxin module
LAQLLAPFPASLPARSPEHSGGQAACGLDTIQQDMERLPQGVRRLAVQLRLNLDPIWLWTVLTDYEHLHEFIPNLASSRLLWRREPRVALEQVGTQQFCGMRFSARVQLELTEERDQGCLRFRMLEGDFRCFEGTWSVGADATSSWLFYDLTVQGRPGMPIGLIEQRLQQDLASNLRGVQLEAIRRASQAA